MGFGSANAPEQSQESLSADVLSDAVELILRQVNKLSETQLSDLALLINMHAEHRGERELSLTDELRESKKILRQLRSQYFLPNGAVKDQEKTDPRQIKEILSTMNSLLTTIGKYEELAKSQDRVLLIERAVVSSIKDMPESIQDQFFLALEDNFIHLERKDE